MGIHGQIRRAAIAATIAALLGACGDGQATSSTAGERVAGSTSTTIPGVRERAPISFRPVREQAGPDRCASGSNDALPSYDRASCFVVSDGLTVTRYAAKRGVSGGPIDAPVLDVTIVDDDLEAFNELATQCFDRTRDCPTGLLAIAYDGVVMSAPAVHEPRFEGDISITGERAAIDALLVDLGLS